MKILKQQEEYLRAVNIQVFTDSSQPGKSEPKDYELPSGPAVSAHSFALFPVSFLLP